MRTYLEKPITKKGWWSGQVVSPEFKRQYCQRKKENKEGGRKEGNLETGKMVRYIYYHHDNRIFIIMGFDA
jgi:hypothetical protein